MSHPFTFRPDTQDAGVFQEVVVQNSYRLPENLRGDEVVVDIGSNIGAFAYAALLRGAAEVHAYEADLANYERAKHNLRDYADRVRLHHAAVWRSDRRESVLYVTELDSQHSACRDVLTATGGQSVRAEALDDLIREVTGGGRRRIDILKIDCEGSEYPILFTSRLLGRVDLILGEFHNFDSGVGVGHPFYSIPERAKVRGFDRFTDAELVPYLRRRGFEVTVERHETIPHLLGVFVATRRASWLGKLASHWQARARAVARRSA